MEFLNERCYTALNADELKVGSKVIAANNIDSLVCKVHDGDDIFEVKEILNASYERRFLLDNQDVFSFVYLVSEPVETWIVYLCREDITPYLTACKSSRWESVKKTYGAKTKLFEGTEDEIEKWYVPRRKFVDVIAAWEDGETIQFLDDSTGNWIDCDVVKPQWSINIKYRIKPEFLKFKPKFLKWTDLKLGDVIRRKDGLRESLVMLIDKDEETLFHIFAGQWLNDIDLKIWEKVE